MSERNEQSKRGGATATRIGLDVGTSKVVTARGDTKRVDTTSQLNAFLTVPYSPLTQSTLQQRDIPHYRNGTELVVYGTAAEKFAHMFNAECRRPMAQGILNPREPAATHVLESILGTLLPNAGAADEVLAFSVPAASAETGADLTYHEETVKRYLRAKGYRPLAVNEGLAVILAELADQSFTGIGISCGGGMCNVALAFLSVPSLTFSIAKGGDFIDASVGHVVQQPATRVKAVKEDNLDLSRPTNDTVHSALQIYYDKLIESLLDELHRAVTHSQKLPRTDEPLPIVLAGGTALPVGFRDRFEKQLRARNLPFGIGEIRLASDPLTATARGTLVAALAESTAEQAA
ncbi:MAG: hypothetical protein ACJ8MR_14250 [Povalibacter sp.]